MRLGMKTCLLLCAAVTIGCVNQHEIRKRDIQHFMQNATGEFKNDSGDSVIMVPVFARMIGLDTMYLERSTHNGTTGRLLQLEPSGDNDTIIQISYMFTQPGQWRNLLQQPELLSALQPNDVRGAGSCDIKLSKDLNTLTYACGGGAPQDYKRVQMHVPD
jgi:CpeT/CpcT family (DUF1001)